MSYASRFELSNSLRWVLIMIKSLIKSTFGIERDDRREEELSGFMKPLKMNVVATKEVKISFVIRSTSFHFARPSMARPVLPAVPESARCRPTRCVSFLFRINETQVLSHVIPPKNKTSDLFLSQRAASAIAKFPLSGLQRFSPSLGPFSLLPHHVS